MTMVFTQIIGILSLGPIYGSNGIAMAFLISAYCGTIFATFANNRDKI